MKSSKKAMAGQFPLIPNWMHNFFENDDVFGTSLLNRDIVPAVNVLEVDKGYDIEVAAPGFDRKDFDVSVDGEMLVVSARHRAEDKKEDDRFMRREFSYSSFSRAFTLPDDAQRKGIKAEYRDGILHIHVDRMAEPKRPEPTKVEIH